MKRLFPKSLVLFIFLALGNICLNSCTKNTFDKVASFQMDPTFNIGLIKGTVGYGNLKNILSDSNSSLSVGSDSFVTFVWQGNISTFTTTDFIPSFTSTPNKASLSANNVNDILNAPINSKVLISDSLSLDITPQRASSVDIDSIYLKSGKVAYSLTNTFSDSCKITILVLGIPGFKQTLTIPANTTSKDSFDISNRWIDMTNGGKNPNGNYLIMVYLIDYTKKKSSQPGSTITFAQQVNNPVMKMMVADVHKQGFFSSTPSNIPLNAFKFAQVGTPITFSDPTINLYFTNTFGVPMGFNFTSLSGQNANGHFDTLNVRGVTPNPFRIDSASVAIVGTDFRVTPAFDTLVLNKSNPLHSGIYLSLPEFLSAMPSTIVPQFNATSNEFSSGRNRNFIQDTSKGFIDAKIVIPLSLKINKFVSKDTFPFSFGDMTNVDSFTLRIAVNNGMPLGLGATISFLDSTKKPNVVIYSQKLDTLISPAPLDANNKANGKTLTVSKLTLGSKVMPKLKNVNKVIFTSTLISPSSGAKPANIYSNQTIDVNIGAKASYKIN